MTDHHHDPDDVDEAEELRVRALLADEPVVVDAAHREAAIAAALATFDHLDDTSASTGSERSDEVGDLDRRRSRTRRRRSVGPAVLGAAAALLVVGAIGAGVVANSSAGRAESVADSGAGSSVTQSAEATANDDRAGSYPSTTVLASGADGAGSSEERSTAAAPPAADSDVHPSVDALLQDVARSWSEQPVSSSGFGCAVASPRPGSEPRVLARQLVSGPVEAVVWVDRASSTVEWVTVVDQQCTELYSGTLPPN